MKVSMKPFHLINQGIWGRNLIRLDEDSLLAKIQEFKQQAEDNAESQYLKIVEAIKNVRDEKLKLGFQTGEEYGADISAKNILKERRDSKIAKTKATI